MCSLTPLVWGVCFCGLCICRPFCGVLVAFAEEGIFRRAGPRGPVICNGEFGV